MFKTLLLMMCSSSTDTMSSQLTTLVPVFDGTNYNNWAKAMKAFLMAQGLWTYANGDDLPPPAPRPTYNDDGTVKEKVPDNKIKEFNLLYGTWQKMDHMALGNITLRLNDAIKQNFGIPSHSNELWSALHDAYGTTSTLTIYKDFKEAVSLRFNPNHHPAATFDRMAACFSRLAEVKIGTGILDKPCPFSPSSRR